MVFFIGLVLALVCAWLICQFIRKFGKRFFTRFIPKFCKVMMWITLGLLVFIIVDNIRVYVTNYRLHRDILTNMHMLPSDLVPQIREHGVRKVWRRWKGDRIPYEEQEAIAKKQFLEEYDEISFRPRPRGFWSNVFHSLKFEFFLYKSKKKGYL